MRTKRTSAKAVILFIAIIGALLIVPCMTTAGQLQPTAPPGPTMKTLQEVYDKLEVIDGKLGGGSTTTTTTISGSTCTDAPVEKTGQTTSYAAGDDGALRKGVALPVPRFTDNGNGTVKDNLTGLIWLKNADCFGQQTWATAITSSNTLNNDECGLSDGSEEGAWRLPNVKELQSLIDFGRYSPALPSGHPFTLVRSSHYWSSTSYDYFTGYAWGVNLFDGFVNPNDKSINADYYVWPVRSGN